MTVGLVTVALAVAAALSATAADDAKGDAKEQMKFGLNAAKRGYWLEALSRYESANELVPGRVSVLNNIAVALEAVGRFEEAMVTYETAIEIAPNDRVLRRNFTQFKEFYDEYVAPPTPVTEEGDDASDADKDTADEVGEPKGDDEEDG